MYIDWPCFMQMIPERFLLWSVFTVYTDICSKLVVDSLCIV